MNNWSDTVSSWYWLFSVSFIGIVAPHNVNMWFALQKDSRDASRTKTTRYTIRATAPLTFT